MSKDKKIYVFAYGSNMYSKRIKARIKSANFFGVGALSGHILKFHKKSKDDSSKADASYTGNLRNDKVWGVVYEINRSDKAELDKFEGLGKGYLEKTEPINLTNNTTKKAVLYYADSEYIDSSLNPYKWYLDLVITGAKENCIQLKYINELSKVAYKVDEKKDRKSRVHALKILPEHIATKMGSYWYVSDWKALRIKFKEDLTFNDYWKKGLAYFKDRLETRYINPMKEIENDDRGSGFTIVSTLCILIELIAAFQKGKIHNTFKSDKGYEYRQSEKFYKEFLKNSKVFEGYFSIKNDKPIFCVDDFYKNVRCALIHEACTKNNWIINTKYHPEIIDKNKPFQINKNLKKIINRNALLAVVETLITDYIEKVEKGDDLTREYFARKMDHICEINPDDSSWWIDK